MDRRTALSGASFLLLTAGVTRRSTAGAKETEKAVLALEDEWLEADKQHNPEKASALLADTYMSTSADGKLESRAKVLSDITDRHYATGEYADMRAAAYGTTAIVRGIFKGSGTEKDGKAFRERLRFTDTWIKQNGDKWSCVATQYTAVS